MRGLRQGLAALAIAGLGLGGTTTATAQADDDWEFAEDAARSLTVAAVRYDSGHAVIAQCANGQLRVLLAGLPATTETSRLLTATRSGGATDTQSWTMDEGGSLTSTLPARDARFLRAGGGLRLRSAPGDSAPINAAFDLPAQSANLDRVLTACGYPLVDDRDAIPRAAPDLRLQRPPREGDVGGRPGRSLELSCIIQNGAYSQCHADHFPKAMNVRSARSEALNRNGSRLHPDDAAANEGKVAYIFVPLLIAIAREGL